MAATTTQGTGSGEAGKKTVYASQVVKKQLVQYLSPSDQGVTVREYSGDTDETFKTISVTNQPETLTNLDIPSAPYYPLGMPRVLNLQAISASYIFWYGGFTDGQYAYMVPQLSGTIPRVNLYDFTTVTSIDLTTIDPDYIFFNGGTTDGRYGYFIPAGASKLVRLDLQDFATADDIDLTTVDASFFYSYFAVILNRFLYTQNNGNVIRINLDDFESGASAVSFVSVPALSSSFYNVEQGCFTDGNYVYMIVNPVTNAPGINPSDILLRIDPNNFTVSGIDVIDLTNLVNSSGTGAIQTGIALNGYIYLLPFAKNFGGGTFRQNGTVIRINSQDLNDITTTNLSNIDASIKGFFGSCSDGKRYIYLCPDYSNSGPQFDASAKCIAVRLDTFNWPNIEFVDISQAPFGFPGGGGFTGGFSDGRYAYMAQAFDPTAFTFKGKLVRFQMFAGGNI